MGIFLMAGVALVSGATLFFLVSQSRARGRAEAERDASKVIYHDVKEKGSIHDLLRIDPEYRKRVRERFTRKE